MTLPALNNELINTILDRIEADPESWNQGMWGRQTDCGTTHCFAGWAAALTPGVEIVWDKHPWTDPNPASSNLIMVGVRPSPNDPVDDIVGWARRQLGFTLKEAARVFFKMTHNPSEMRDLINSIRLDRLPAQADLTLAAGSAR